MKTKHKSIISIFLAMLMLFSVLPTGTITASASTLTLSQLKAKFPQGKYWNHVGSSSNNENGYTSTPCPSHTSTSTCNAFTYGGTKIGWQCFGFACKLGYDAYGSNPKNWERAYNLNNIKPGDIINYDGSDPGHTVFVTGVSGDTVYFAECNYGGRCLISWDRSLKKSQFNNLYSVYVAPKALSSGSHVCSFSGSYFESAHPHKVYQKCSCGKTQYTGATKAYQNCSTCMKLSASYVQPVKAYTINTGKTTVYNAVSGTAKSNKIYDTDLCTINQIYDCGWCKVTFPLDSGGTETGYCKISVFMKGGGYVMYTSRQVTTYRRSDLKTTNGYAVSGDKIYVLGLSGSAVQIAYPLSSGGWKVGWIPTSSIKFTIAYNSNGGTGNMSATTAQYNGALKLSANKFTKTGYTFGGWNVYRSSDKKWYASGQGWKTASEINSKGYTKSVYKNELSCTLNSSWTNLGKTNDTITFYAVWSPNKLIVNYNANGGTINSDTYKVKNNVIYKISNDEKVSQLWTYNQPLKNGLCNASTFGLTKAGYTFKGWGTTASGGIVFNENDTQLVPSSINSAIKTGNCTSTLYAIWEPVTYTIKYDANGGTGAPAQQTKVHNQTLRISSEQPVRNGFEFIGWSKSKTATSPQFLSGEIYDSNNSVTLYAVWKAIAPPEAHIHQWEKEYTVDIEPTCTENGIKSIHCKTCNETTDSIQISPTGHSLKITDYIEPTCTQKGYSIGTCTKCNEKVIAGTISQLGHQTENDKAIEPTCTQTGLTAGKHCSVCGEILVEQKVVEALGHKPVTDKAVASTCEVTGLTEGSHCSVCGEMLVKQDVVAKKAHTYKNYVTKATTSANGSIVNKCSVCGTKKSTSTIYKVSSVALSTYSTYYNGSVKTPGVTVKDSKGKTLKKGTDYDVTYASGRKNVGRYAVTIKLKGNYSGTKTLHFNIIPKGTSISKVTASSKGLKVQWNTQKTQTTGYQIQYSTSSNFSNAKTITMPKNTYSAKSISGLAGNKKYYVRIRTYKVTKFGGKNYNIYSPWSSTKSVTTKK